MDELFLDVITLLTTYWKKPGALDVRTKNYCRLLSDNVCKELPAAFSGKLIHEPQNYVQDLDRILGQLSRTDPNSRQLINILLRSVNHTSTKRQSVNVSGNNNQVITIGGNMVGESMIQNNTNFIPEDVDSRAKTAVDPSSVQTVSRNDYEDKVFVSYAWGGESEKIVEELEQVFAEHGIHIIRDKKDLAYKGSIETFEQRIGKGKYIVLVISDKYLHSEHCMYELVQAQENRDLRERIFPIILRDAHIYKALDRLDYIKYWEEQIRQLNQAIKKVDVMTNLSSITADLDKYAKIRANFDHLTDLLSDMNVLTPEQHAAHGFSTLINILETSIKDRR